MIDFPSSEKTKEMDYKIAKGNSLSCKSSLKKKYECTYTENIIHEKKITDPFGFQYSIDKVIVKGKNDEDISFIPEKIPSFNIRIPSSKKGRCVVFKERGKYTLVCNIV